MKKVVLLGFCLLGGLVAAQTNDMSALNYDWDAFSKSFGPLSIALTIVAYIYFALCLQTIANKTNTENAWLAWIPIANIYLMTQIAGRPGWWLLLMFIPLVNIVIAIILWMGIAKARNKPEWLGITVILPFINLIVVGYLAFSE